MEFESCGFGTGEEKTCGPVGGTVCDTSGRFLGTFVAYFSCRLSTNCFRGVTVAMGTEGAEECGALDIVLG